MNTTIFVVLALLLVGAVIFTLFLCNDYKKTGSISLMQYRLENSDSAIGDAMPYLKLTNEWE